MLVLSETYLDNVNVYFVENLPCPEDSEGGDCKETKGNAPGPPAPEQGGDRR